MSEVLKPTPIESLMREFKILIAGADLDSKIKILKASWKALKKIMATHQGLGTSFLYLERYSKSIQATLVGYEVSKLIAFMSGDITKAYEYQIAINSASMFGEVDRAAEKILSGANPEPADQL